MNGNRSYAWAVAISNDESIENAILSGQTLRNTDSSGAVLAIASNSISKSFIPQLGSVFDLVIVKDVESLATKMDPCSELDALLLSTLNMTTFSKLLVIRPGVLVLQQSDKLFDSDNLGMLDNDGRWAITVISPDKKTYTQVLDKLKTSHFTWKSSTDIMNLIFFDNWIAYTDKWIVYNGQVEQATKIKDNLEYLPTSSTDMDSSDWIAIVGMSCRFPEANSAQEYWDLLASGRNACSFPPDHRTKLVDLDPQTKANFLKCPIDQFDAPFFGFSPSEATFTDPQARLLLEVSWEALEDAAMNPDTLKGTRTGVFYGSWLQEYRDAMNTEGSPANEDFIRKYLGNSFGCSAAKLSFFYGFTGPNVSTESGCSSSMVAVDLAVKSLQKRECPVAVVAGANVLLHMNVKQKVLWAEDGKSKTFDADANGYARAEGVAVLILKRFSDAKRDGDRVHAVIRGSAMSQEGLSKSFGTPTVDSEDAAMRGAMRRAEVQPCEVDYVEAHATGTAVGDPIEAQAIVKAYSGDKRRQKPLYIGSGKTNVGHTESCSGLAGIFKVVLAMKNELIPAHLNVSKLNPQVNFDSIPGKIPLEAVPWPREKCGKPRIAGVSSFGITGTDVHVIIQEGPEQSVALPKAKSFPLHLLTLSSKSESALEELTQRYINYLENSIESIENITFTANACKAHHPIRLAVLGGSKIDLRNNLAKGIHSRGKGNPPKICFTFPGRIGLMDLEPARILYKTCPIFQNTMNYCEKLFRESTGMHMLHLLTDTQSNTISKGVAWYALIPAVQYSLVKLWNSWGIYPDCVMGHCIGEISAAVVSGALALEDVFKLVKCMDYFLQVGREQPALMIAIQASTEKTEEFITLFLENNRKNESDWIEVASSNAFDQTVVAGDIESIGYFKKFLTEQGCRCKLLSMDFCAHSRAVEPACQRSLETFNGISHQKMKIPYISSVTGQVVQDGEMDGHYWYNVFRQSVKFTESCRTTSTCGLADVYIEMGLEGALSRLTQENLRALEMSSVPPACLPSLWKMQGDKCWMGLLNSLGQLYVLGGSIDWNGYFGDQAYYNRVELPKYPFQRKSYWFERRKKNVEIEEPINFQSLVSNTQNESVHPLLGVAIETCVEDPIIFQNWMSKKDTTHFIYDHIIGSQVIFPGAAFLEMILAAVDYCDGRHNLIHVEGFTVSSPLWLEESTPKRMQCVVNKRNQTGNVYAWSTEIDSKPWKLHSEGRYTVGLEGEDLEENTETVDDIKQRCLEKSSGSEEFYSAAKQVGLNFGNDFRSMKNIFQVEGGSETLIELILPQDEERNGKNRMGFVCHPILIDAMIQGMILHTKPELTKLHVPVRIGRFSVRRGISNNDVKWYVHCKTEQVSGLLKSVNLINQAGIVMATMTNAELVMTSVESVLKAAGCVATTEPKKPPRDMVTLRQFDVVWKRGEYYQCGNSIQLETSDQEEMRDLLQHLEEILKPKNIFSREESSLDRKMNRLCQLYVVKAIYDLGWSPSDGIKNLSHDATEIMNVLPGLVPAYKHFISYLDIDLITEMASNRTQLAEEIDKLLTELQDYAALKTVQACGSQLAKILQGSVNPHMILFGGTATDDVPLAEHFYKTTRFAKVGESLEEAFKIIHKQIQRCKKVTSETVRILEVGAGTGRFANGVRHFFGEQARGVKYEYTFTDISSSFLIKAKETFGGEPFLFKTFNIENDPLKQGFCPDYFDMVVAMDVVHATRNVKDSLANLELVTKSGGWILLAETEKPVMEVDICFGILEGYWLIEDGIRKEHCTLTGDKWLELLNETGFRRAQGRFLSCNSQMSVIAAQKEHGSNDTTSINCCRGNWLVLFDDDQEDWTDALEIFAKRMKSFKRKVTKLSLKNISSPNEVIRCLDDNQDAMLEGIIYWMGGSTSLESPPESRKVLEPLLYVGKYLLQKKLKTCPRFHLVTDECLNTVAEVEAGLHSYGDPNKAQAWGFMRNLRIELPGIISKSIDFEKGTDVHERCSQLIPELWLDDKETEVTFRAGVRYLRRALYKDPPRSEVNIGLNECSRYYTIELPKSKMISDVRFVKMEEPLGLAADEMLVEVKSVSLNFKDVLAVMKPSPDFEQITSIGLDFSGVVTSTGDQVTKYKVGQPVFGCGWEQGAMKSHVVTKEAALVSMPDWMTFNEAATLPAVWLTAWYCMVEVAGLRKGQTVLIHAASGGVGLIAIQIAKLLGVNVIGTAGTEKKRKFLQSLGVEHVFNSRTVEFGKYIQQITNGNGVDMVLNCLTGPGFKEASLEVCRDGGHFVEISKLDIWTQKQVKERRPGVVYTIVDVTQVDKMALQGIMNKLTRLLDNGTIKPLPYVQYPASSVRDALTYLQKAKQIGKVILTLPQFEETESGGHHREYLFNNRSSYLITGGKGAIGLGVAKWMVTQGAKYLVLVGRSAATETVQQAIKEIEREYGAVIICKEVDISDQEHCKILIEELTTSTNGIPPLRGIHHCAGVLSDKLLSHHDSWSSYESVIRPKVQGAWNFHTLTRNLSLEFFVLYSSAASTFGNIGQSNYVAANCYLDSLAEMRVAMGLPCLSVNWGQWNVGFAKGLSVDWLHPFTAEEGVATLEILMKNKVSPSVVTGLFDFYGLLKMTPYYKDTFLENLCLDQVSFFGRDARNPGSVSENRDGRTKKLHFIEQYEAQGTKDEDQRNKLVRDFVVRMLCETLGTKPDEINGDDQHFSEMGMDSLMSIEFANKINSEMEGVSEGGFIDLEEFGTVSKMTAWISESLTKLTH